VNFVTVKYSLHYSSKFKSTLEVTIHSLFIVHILRHFTCSPTF